MKIVWFVAFCTGLVFGCGETSGVDSGIAGNGGSGGAQSTPIEVTEASFDCILEGTKVRKFYVQNLVGNLEGSLAVANGAVDPPYPPGTLLQLVPQEAMVKREAGFSPETRDWEFFFLRISSGGTTIVERGRDEAENAFGGNCFACHSLATDNDFICETDNGCDPLMIDDAFIEMLQVGDVRCD
ncbi:MAG: hypothetical protein O7F08_07460 [Deltaproteobacteria bacterium]|nr:hypothetical protein [Deltaproteobacteria bacterium]